MKNRPNGIRFNELEKVLNHYGYILVRTTGLHHQFRNDEGAAVMDCHLIERKALLDQTPEGNDVFSRIRYVEGNATELFHATGEAGLEGIVIKRKDSRYHPGKRSWAWQKVIYWQEAEMWLSPDTVKRTPVGRLP